MSESPFLKTEKKEILAYKLFVDKRYQRILDLKRATKIAREFDPAIFKHLEVSDRNDDTFAVIDGQHRLAAIIIMGWHDQLLPCIVYIGLTPKEEAEQFSKAQTSQNRKPLPINDIFRSQLFYEDEEAIEIRRIIESVGFSLNLTGGGAWEPGQVSAIGTVQRIYKQQRKEDIGQVLTILREAWGFDGAGVKSSLLEGVARFHQKYRDLYNRKRLIIKMQEMTPRRVMADGNDQSRILGLPSATGVGRTLLKVYNNGLRSNRLPEWEDYKAPPNRGKIDSNGTLKEEV